MIETEGGLTITIANKKKAIEKNRNEVFRWVFKLTSRASAIYDLQKQTAVWCVIVFPWIDICVCLFGDLATGRNVRLCECCYESAESNTATSRNL